MMQPADPALPDRSEDASKGDFKWPCNRHYVHDAHTIHQPGQVMSHPGEQCECPGVKAHPNTMIGRL